jgi:hypothetical protein
MRIGQVKGKNQSFQKIVSGTAAISVYKTSCSDLAAIHSEVLCNQTLF